MTRDGGLERARAELETRLGSGRVGVHVPLGPFTTFKVGGRADLFVEPRSSDELAIALAAADAAGVPVTMLGGGSNVLVSDAGVRGLVIRPKGGVIGLESPGRVRADAAVTINGLVRWTIGRGLAGLEAWAGTPGTVGGGVYGNAHWGGRLIGELIASVRLWDAARGSFDVPAADMEFGYDRSRLQRTGETLLSALFVVSPADPASLRQVARQSLAYRKRTQPLESPSAGCIFQNPPPGTELPEGVARSAGALVDRAGLKGARIGGARVSPTHANFIVNEGGATAADIRALIERCREAVRARFGVELREEIVYLGEFHGLPEAPRVDTAH
jgi:UDP-N-acetylmuramate dehydrogenase